MGGEIELRPEIIGIIVGFLTLIYPLTYIYIHSIARDLFELRKNHNLKINRKTYKHIIHICTFRYLFGFLMNAFLLTGIAFVVTYLLFITKKYKYFTLCLLILLIIEVILCFLPNIRRKKVHKIKYYLFFVSFEVFYIIGGIKGIIGLCNTNLRCSQEAYNIFTLFGILLILILLYFFLIGIIVGSLRHIEKLRYIAIANNTSSQENESSTSGC